MNAPVVNVFDIDDAVVNDHDIIAQMTCSICYELVPDTGIECLACQHVFHDECIQNMLRANRR